MIRQGHGTPLVLLHGVLGGEAMWRQVVPLLAVHHDTIAVTALGHRGGRPAIERPARIRHVIDDAERHLDELRIGRAHLAGNSMGGWVALELARRGRALSVCALSPAGCWDGTSDRDRTTGSLHTTLLLARLGRPVLPLIARSARGRRWAMAPNAAYGDRLAPAALVAAADDVLGCEIGHDLLATADALGPLDPPPCPITIAWSALDRILPLHVYGDHARRLVPGARFVVLDDVGHVPMFDAPEMVARTILESTGGARTPRRAAATERMAP
jgi:pimeloyl-ACP methyl ester carboxylesterase